jgi:signal transduction histidine kinase
MVLSSPNPSYSTRHASSKPHRSLRVLLQFGEQRLKSSRCRSEPNTPIALRLSTDAGRVLLSVTDNGGGIGASELPHVFEPFYRSPQARRLGRSGVGLGLAVARRIAEAFGGELSASSEVGTGSCFVLSLASVEAAGAVACGLATST